MPAYWKVNSYGYPNPFSQLDNAVEAWNTLLSFYEFKSYERLKEYWASTAAPRTISASALESWKAAFEEYGLVHVPAGSDQVKITPAGVQFREAAEDGDEHSWTWIGLNALLRYPLRGPRANRRGELGSSDLLLYWFFFACLLDLHGHIWWDELSRILCRTIRHDEALVAVEEVRALRSGRARLEDFDRPVSDPRGAFYNSLNQVAVHASLYYHLVDKTSASPPFCPDSNVRRHGLKAEWADVVSAALGSDGTICISERAGYVARMPKAPAFSDEEAYFEYAGARVPPYETSRGPTVPDLTLAGQRVAFLKSSVDYESFNGRLLIAAPAKVCRLAPSQRLIVSENLNWSYLVQSKARLPTGKIEVTVRRARPTSDTEVIRSHFEEHNLA